MNTTETLDVLLKRAHIASEKQKAISQTRFAGDLKYWGIAYYMLSDKEAAESLFDEAIRIFDEQIGGRDCPIVTDTRSLWLLSMEDSDLYDAYRFKDETIYVRRRMEVDEPLIKLDRSAIVKIPLEDLSVLTGMNQYFQSLQDSEKIANGESIPWLHPNFMTTIRDRKKPMFEHRLFTKELPEDIIADATKLANDYYSKTDALSTAGKQFDSVQAIAFHNHWASVIRRVYVEYLNRLFEDIGHKQTPLK